MKERLTLTEKFFADRGVPQAGLKAFTDEYLQALYSKLSHLEDILEKYGINGELELDNRLSAVDVIRDLNRYVRADTMSDFIDYVKRRAKLDRELGIDVVKLFQLMENGIDINGHHAYDIELYKENGEYWIRTEFQDNIRVIDISGGKKPLK